MVNKVWAVLGLVPSSKTFGRHPDDQRCQNLHWVVVQLHTCITLQHTTSSQFLQGSWFKSNSSAAAAFWFNYICTKYWLWEDTWGYLWEMMHRPFCACCSGKSWNHCRRPSFTEHLSFSSLFWAEQWVCWIMIYRLLRLWYCCTPFMDMLPHSSSSQ